MNTKKKIKIPTYINYDNNKNPNPKGVFGTQQTRTQKTEDIYKKRLVRILEQSIKLIDTSQVKIEEIYILKSDSLIKYFSNKSVNYAKNTLRSYKAMIQFYFDFQYQKNRIDLAYYDNVTKSLNDIYKERLKTAPKKSTLTSGLKSKRIPESLVKKLEKKLLEHNSKYSQLTLSVFIMSMEFGLRPSEWFNSEILHKNYFHEEKQECFNVILKIKNAKSTNGRSFGEFRYIGIEDDYDYKQIIFILDRIQSLRNEGIKQDVILASMRREMNLANIKTNDKKHITLYTARHQFSANVKNVLSKDQVADLMGHGSNETAGIHYGKKRSGHLAYKEASKEANKEVSNVSNTLQENKPTILRFRA